MSIAVAVNNVSKLYKLYAHPKDRLKETLDLWHRSFHTAFYALKDVSFTIHKGESVGIIGKNGAGKSTLLKLITGLLHPTSGTIQCNGRISSLLELGAGFNPEMTGLENVYINGFIMGYSREDMKKCLPDILEFADIGDFIHQPVKTYSSGMFARLAFALSISVSPDILIIDEALSVGDVRFQRKCYARFQELQDNGVTIFFVSHDLDAVRTYTQRVLYFKDGVCVGDGAPDKVTCAYLADLFPKEESPNIQFQASPYIRSEIASDYSCFLTNADSRYKTYGNGFASVDWIGIQGMSNPNIFTGGEQVTFDVSIHWNSAAVLKLCADKKLRKNIIVGMYIENKQLLKIFAFNTFESNIFIDPNQNKALVQFSLKMPVLAPGDYFLLPSVALGEHLNHEMLVWHDEFGIIRSKPQKSAGFMGLFVPDYRAKIVQ